MWMFRKFPSSHIMAIVYKEYFVTDNFGHSTPKPQTQ